MSRTTQEKGFQHTWAYSSCYQFEFHSSHFVRLRGILYKLEFKLSSAGSVPSMAWQMRCFVSYTASSFSAGYSACSFFTSSRKIYPN